MEGAVIDRNNNYTVPQHRPGQPESRGPVLQLGELRPREAGDYRCVARNGHPPAIVKTVRLHVMCEYLH